MPEVKYPYCFSKGFEYTFQRPSGAKLYLQLQAICCPFWTPWPLHMATHRHTHTHTCTQSHTYTYLHTDTDIHIPTHRYMHIHICTQAETYTYMHIGTHTHIPTHDTHRYIYTYTDTQAHTYTYLHTRNLTALIINHFPWPGTWESKWSRVSVDRPPCCTTLYYPDWHLK